MILTETRNALIIQECEIQYLRSSLVIDFGTDTAKAK